MTAAARLPARKLPANSQFCRPSAIGPDAVLHPVVVDGHVAVVQEARERLPAVEAVVDRPRGG
jgi:hypothetical protein